MSRRPAANSGPVVQNCACFASPGAPPQGRSRSDEDSGSGGGEQFGRVVSEERLGIAGAGEGEAKVRPEGIQLCAALR
jgi:hypothetical protein